jgi:two-component system chemotaxis sensor kinase CheA
LGNGSLALILDVAETAERAGVRAVEESAKRIEAAAIEAGHDAKFSLLVFEDRGGERKALPLDVVERIESVPLERIEYAGGRTMLQYRGELLPLEDDGELLRELAGSPGVVATVLICGERCAGGVRRSGRVVRRVLDVTAGTWLENDDLAEGEIGDAGLALVNERVTAVCRGKNGALRSGLREVA